MRLKGRKFWLTILVLALIFIGCGLYFFRQHCLSHYRVVEKGSLYRSGQPRGLGLFYLHAAGFRTIISVRGTIDASVEAERAYAERHGIKYVNLPISHTNRNYGEQVAQFLEIMSSCENYPVLVHCSRGKERSGLLSAVYRMEHEGWDSRKALYEAYRLGLTPGTYESIEAFIWGYESGKNTANEGKVLLSGKEISDSCGGAGTVACRVPVKIGDEMQRGVPDSDMPISVEE